MSLDIQRKEPTVGRGIRLPKSVDDWLREMAKAEGVSENQIVIASLKKVMALEGSPKKR